MKWRVVWSDNVEKIKIKKSHLKIAIIVVLVLVGAFFLFGVSQNKQGISSTNVVDSPSAKPAPDVSFTTISGKGVKLSDYKGKKVMLWFFATWCPTCQAGAQALEENNNQLGNLQILAVKTYKNAGYNGVSTKDFAQSNVPNSLEYDNWVWGNASQKATQIYNPKNYPDIYYLIDENGNVINVNGAPGATINSIISFANGRS